jgi:hypothetical protein
MADFMTRLAERTLSVAPVVQPLITPTFATERTIQSLDPEWDSEAAAPPLEQTSDFPAASKPARRLPREALEGAARGEEQDPGERATPPRSGASKHPPDPSHTPEAKVSTNRKSSGRQDNNMLVPAASDRPKKASVAGVAEGGAAESEEEERKAPPVTPLLPQKALEPQIGPPPRPNDINSIETRVVPERDRQDPPQADMGRRSPKPPVTLHHVQPETTRRRVLPTSQRALSETSPLEPSPAGYETTRDPSRLRGTTVERENGDGRLRVPVLTPGNGAASPDVGRATLTQAEASPGYSTPDAHLSVASRSIRLRPGGHPERGPQEEDLRVSAPESPAPPTIRVSIGRIEVRAITPPPAPPVQPARSARPGPELSLDDYLKQRNGRQR